MGRYAVCLTRLTAILYKLWRSEMFSVLLQLPEGHDGCPECYRHTAAGHTAQLQVEVEFEDHRRNRRPKRFWMHPWLSARRRLELGHYHRLMRELRMEDTTSFFNYLRMQRAMALFHYDIAVLRSIAMSTQTVLPVS